ncbi:MAG: LapA family protein [Phycisphaerales bacterium]|nr:MAG: LapA family protein [Phycisphaerales bacterium]
MKKAKIIIIAIVTLLALIVFLQNTETVETKFLFTKITMPRVLLLIMTFMTGFVVGLITASHVLRSSVRSDKSLKKT